MADDREEHPQMGLARISEDVNEDMLTEVLWHLPPKAVVSFGVVSRKWHSLIFDQNFIQGYIQRNSTIVAGLLLSSSPPEWFLRPVDPNYELFSLEEESKLPLKKNFQINNHNPFMINIFHDCNGLWLCNFDTRFERQRGGTEDGWFKHYVLNPATGQFWSVPSQPFVSVVSYMNLLYHPLELHGFMVVFVESLDLSISQYKLHLYSSHTGVWEACPESYIFQPFTNFEGGVFWKRAVHWVNGDCTSYRFDIDEKTLMKLPSPAFADGLCCLRYFGESRGHLYLVAFHRKSAAFIAYEMEDDLSGWFMKYTLPSELINASFLRVPYEVIPSSVVLALVEVKDEGPTLVFATEKKLQNLDVIGQVLSYSFERGTFMLLHYFNLPESLELIHAFKYIESLSLI